MSNLEGAGLDMVVALAEGLRIIQFNIGRNGVYRRGSTGHNQLDFIGYLGDVGVPQWSPSTFWEHGGPIIEREKISIVASMSWNMRGPLEWSARVGPVSHYIDELMPLYGGGAGPTPLIAAMRAFVASKTKET